jgi:DNA-binding beta-propeller fold protein YncE
MSVALGTSDSAAQSVDEFVAAPGCSTAVAAGPVLSKVATSFVPVALGEPFGIAIAPVSHDAFVASRTGSIVEYAMNSLDLRAVQTDTFGASQSHRIPIDGTSPVGLSLSPDGKYLVAASESDSRLTGKSAISNDDRDPADYSRR